jgi:hypothetical protein
MEWGYWDLVYLKTQISGTRISLLFIMLALSLASAGLTSNYLNIAWWLRLMNFLKTQDNLIGCSYLKIL